MPDDAGFPSPSVDRPRGPDGFALFSFLWAASVLFHIGSYDRWATSGLEAAAAVWVLFRPRSTVAIAALMALQIASIFPTGSRTPNHAVFAAIVCTGLLASAGVLLAVRRRLDRRELFDTFAPVARWSLIVLYGFAVFHKLNTEWFDPKLSCAVMFLDRQRSMLPASIPFEAAAWFSIYASLGCELLIPVLLIFRATRRAGVFVGLAFHWLLATNPISGFYNFSSMLFAMFSLFVDEDLIARLIRTIGRGTIAVLQISMAALAAGYVLAEFVAPEWLPPSRVVARGAWQFFGSSLLFVWVAVLLRSGTAGSARTLYRLPYPALAVVPLLAFLNGAAPYLGLHTTANFAMFSNLRTEGGRTNHLLVPARVQVFGYQRDVVRLVDSSDTDLRAWRGNFVPYFELRRRPDASVTYERAGVRYRFDRITDDPAYGGPPPKVVAAWLAFRPYQRGVRQACVH